jgi:hypothetical protein
MKLFGWIHRPRDPNFGSVIRAVDLHRFTRPNRHVSTQHDSRLCGRKWILHDKPNAHLSESPRARSPNDGEQQDNPDKTPQPPAICTQRITLSRICILRENVALVISSKGQ